MIASFNDEELSKLIKKQADTQGRVVIIGKKIVNDVIEVNFKIR